MTKYFVLVIALLVTACSRHDSCEQLVDAEKYAEALDVCLSEYQEQVGSRPLVALTRVLGELKQFAQMDQLVNDAVKDKRAGEAFLLAGSYARRSGDFVSAERHYNAAAEILTDPGQENGRADALNGLFYFAWRRSEHKRAISLANSSLHAAKIAGDPALEIQALNNLFRVFEETGNLGPAEHALDQITELLDRATPKNIKINVHIHKGNLYMSQGRSGLASNEFEKALALAAGSKNRTALRGLYLNTIYAKLELGELQQASEHLKTAWQYANPDGSATFGLLFYQARLEHALGNYAAAKSSLTKAIELESVPQVWVWELHYRLGKTLQALADSPGAVEAFKASIMAIEDLREEISYDALRANLLARKRAPYEALFAEYVRLGENDKALEIMREAKERSFVEDFLGANQTLIADQQNSYRFDDESRRIDQIQGYLNSLKASKLTNSGTESRSHVLTPTEIAVSYFVAEDELYIFRSTLQGGEIHTVQGNFAELTELMHLRRSDPDNHELLEAIGQIILPTHVLAKNVEHIYIVPDNQIGGLPFASLRFDNKFLVETYSFSLIPNLSLLDRDRVDRIMGEESWDTVVAGDPLGDLPAAKFEAEFVAKLFNSSAITGEQVTLSSLTQNARPELLHLATHSGVNNLGPWIQVADKKISGFELVNSGISPKLTVLASCASGAPQDRYLWGSLGGQFLSSGTATVLASLWSVEDEVTQSIIADFYRFYTEGYAVADALASAQQAAINRGLKPSSWGAFTLLGEASNVFSRF